MCIMYIAHTLIHLPLQGVASLYLSLMMVLTGMQMKAYNKLMLFYTGTPVTNREGKTVFKDIEELEDQPNYV